MAKKSNDVSKKLYLPADAHSDCSEDKTFNPRTAKERRRNLEHGGSKGSRGAQHLSCKHQNTQYNQYTYGLHPIQRERYRRRRNSDYARKCIHPECVRSRRKLPPAQMTKHWMTRHEGPTIFYEVHKGCRDSHRK